MNLMLEIRKKAKAEELDYLFFMDALSGFKHPRDKLTALLKSKNIIRVKKGLYVFGKDYQKRPYSLEILANQIYGPSYISMEYALSYYGMIPERVSRVTSMCFKRIKKFKTPVAEFIYYFIDAKKFPVGITWEAIAEDAHFLIATREKALADYIAKQKSFSTQHDLLIYLVEGMRIEERVIKGLRHSLMEEIAHFYQNKNTDLLCQIVKK